MIAAQPAHAQGEPGDEAEATSDNAAPVPEIIVTAQKREERLVNVPASITAETGFDLERRGAAQLEDIIRNTPGISNSGAGQGNSTNITIRGVSTGTGLDLKQSTVALLFDDIPVDPQTASTLTTNLRTVDIGRVEVLRGPQGTLFGSGSLSGAVRFITNKPDVSGFGGSAEVTAATTRGGEESYWGNFVLNAPLVDDRLAVRAVGYGFQDGGWVDNVATGERDVNRVETYGGRLAVAYTPSERLSLNLTGVYQDSKDLGGGESLYAPTPGVSDFTDSTNLVFSPSAQLTNTIVNLAGSYEFDGATLALSSTYQKRETDTRQDIGFLLGLPSALNAITSDFDIFTQELRLSSNGTGPLRWTVGAFYLNADGGGLQDIRSPTAVLLIGTDKLGDLATSGGQEELSGFGEVTLTLADRLDLTGGLRVARTKVAFTTVSSGFLLTGNPDPAVTVSSDLRQRETSVSPRFSVAYRPRPDTTIYAQAARGYRVGGPNLSAGLTGGLIPESYDSDSLWNYEVGAKARLAGGRVRLSAAAFYIDWSDIQVGLLNGVSYTDNAGAARITGFEFETAVRPTNRFEVGGSFTYTRSELTEDAPLISRVTGTVGVSDGDRLPASPEIQAAGFAEWNLPVGTRDAYLRATVQYIGEQYTDFAEQGSRFGDFATLDLRAGVDLGAFELALFANNLFDSEGKRSAVDALAFRPQLAYRIRPRTIGVTLRARFGSEAR